MQLGVVLASWNKIEDVGWWTNRDVYCSFSENGSIDTVPTGVVAYLAWNELRVAKHDNRREEKRKEEGSARKKELGLRSGGHTM